MPNGKPAVAEAAAALAAAASSAAAAPAAEAQPASAAASPHMVASTLVANFESMTPAAPRASPPAHASRPLGVAARSITFSSTDVAEPQAPETLETVCGGGSNEEGGTSSAVFAQRPTQSVSPDPPKSARFSV